MKKFYLTTTIILFLFICSKGILAQTVMKNLDQTALMKKFLGSWHQNVGKDTVEEWNTRQYGKAFEMKVYLIIKGKKSNQRLNNYTFDSETGNFKGYQVYFNGDYDTWIGSFTSEKMFSFEMTRNFSPATTIYKYEMVFESPYLFTLTRFDNGAKAGDYKFHKAK